jgi:DtxR family transcriptional regulator, Mn-dependent transcriptional regulator
VGELLSETILRHRTEDLAEEIWTQAESGRHTIADVESRSQMEQVLETLQAMERDGLVLLRDGEVRLTEPGERMAVEIVRRHRLAETLFSQIFDLQEEEAEKTACEFEHILSPQVTSSVCTYLGHPPACPHGKAIPRGGCCSTFRVEMVPLIGRLADLKLGTEGTIVFMTPDSRSRLARLSGLGVVPGSTVRLIQKRPSVVLEVGQTTLALDRVIADEIFVRRAGD